MVVLVRMVVRTNDGGSAEQSAIAHESVIVGAELNVGRGYEKDSIANSLHLTPKPIGQTATEVDETSPEFGVGLLQVQDHRSAAAKSVSDLLSIVEAARCDQLWFRPRNSGNGLH